MSVVRFPSKAGDRVDLAALGVDGLQRSPIRVPTVSPAEEVGRWLADRFKGKPATPETAQWVAAIGTEYSRRFELGERVEVRPLTRTIIEDAGWIQYDAAACGWRWRCVPVAREVDDWSRLVLELVVETISDVYVGFDPGEEVTP